MKVIGHKQAEDLLFATNLAASRSFLLEGPKGVGKAMLAQKFACHVLGNTDRVLGKSHPDFLLIEKRSEEGKKEILADDARNLRSFLELTPAEGKHRVAIIDSADELNTQAANSILKMVEEPPKNAVIVLLSHGGYVLPTIRSRCLALRLKPLANDDLRHVIGMVMKNVTESDLELLTQISDGSPGIAKLVYENEGLWIIDNLAQIIGRYPSFDYLAAVKFAEKLDKIEGFWEVYNYLFNWLINKLVKAAACGQEFEFRAEKINTNINMPLLLDELDNWHKTAFETGIFNLDKKQVIINSLSRLAACFV
jgi:DNA polymerase-3 subunit delta'